jgi:multidrug efflux pump subunit AcrA (membrane-fusion protein)
LKDHFSLCLTIAAIFLLGCQNEKESAEVLRRDIKELIYASATINSADMYHAYAPVPGIIDEIFVEEGDTVNKDQLLAVIRRDNATLNTRDAALNLALTKNQALEIEDQLVQLESEIDIMKQQLERDSSLYARQKNLWERNIGSKNDLDRIETAFENSQTRFIRLKSRYRLKNDQLREQIALQEQRARILLEQRQNNSSDYEIRSQM